VEPGQLVVEHQGQKVVLPLLDTGLITRLQQDMGLGEVKRQLEYRQYRCLLENDPEATYGDLWRALGQPEESRRRSPRDYDYLPAEPLDHEQLETRERRLQDLEVVPAPVKKKVLQTLVDHYGCKKGQAEAMIKAIAGLRSWCCPEVSELKSGEAVWLTYSTKKSRKKDPRMLIPVVLTVLSPDEQSMNISHRGDFKKLKLQQIERVTTQAWRQDGVLTNIDVEWMLGVSPTTIRELLESYQEKFGIILPTAGTVLDMGRAMTHKKS